MPAETNSTEPACMPKWLEAKLFENILQENVEDFKNIKEFVVKPGTAAGENYATVILKVEIEAELNDSSTKKLTFMMKVNHQSEEVNEKMKDQEVFEIEKGMYDDIVPEFEKLYADVGVDVKFGAKSYDLPVKQEYILLENLCQRGFKNANRLEGLDKEHTESVLKKLAQWHAASAQCVAVKGPFEKKYTEGYFKTDGLQVINEMFEGWGKSFVTCAKQYSNFNEYGKDLKSATVGLFDALAKLNIPNPNEFNVLNHGDCWCNNVMFQYNAFGKIKETFLIDYQIPKYGTPAQDLYYFLLSSTKYEIKIKEFDYFIKFYHDHLVQHLRLLKYSKNIPSLSELHAMLFKYGIWGFTTACGVMGVVLLDPTKEASFENFFSDSDAGMSFKNLLFSNHRYRKHAELVLPWLHNRGSMSF